MCHYNILFSRGVVQLVRMLACHAGGRRFESENNFAIFSSKSIFATVVIGSLREALKITPFARNTLAEKMGLVFSFIGCSLCSHRFVLRACSLCSHCFALFWAFAHCFVLIVFCFFGLTLFALLCFWLAHFVRIACVLGLLTLFALHLLCFVLGLLALFASLCFVSGLLTLFALLCFWLAHFVLCSHCFVCFVFGLLTLFASLCFVYFVFEIYFWVKFVVY